MNPVVFLSRLKSWWQRKIFRRSRHSDAVAISEAAPTPAPACAVVEAETPSKRSEQRELADARVVAPRAIDPAVRARTMESLRTLRQIPSLQSLAQGFAAAAVRENVSVEDVVAAVEKDPALCVRVLRMANSATVHSERRIEDVFTAVQMLGLRRIATLRHALFTMRDTQRLVDGLDWRHLWVHSLATAEIAEELERQIGLESTPQLYLAALLHDVGKIVLATVAPEAYRAVLAGVWSGTARLEQLERETLGVTHAEAGVVFAEQCGLPREVIAGIAHHSAPMEASEHRQLVALVSAANFLAKQFGLGFSGAKLDESDGEVESLPAWEVIRAETGRSVDWTEIDETMRQKISDLKTTLHGLRDAPE